MAQWSKVVGAPSRKQLLRTTRGKVYLFMGVWRQVAARKGAEVPISLCLRWVIKLQDSVREKISVAVGATFYSIESVKETRSSNVFLY